ncbi:hypothetical protein Taro_006388, partial [Colocasia esculenta]|nr:hypothetical protein [Colocasia esculenta]
MVGCEEKEEKTWWREDDQVVSSVDATDYQSSS